MFTAISESLFPFSIYKHIMCKHRVPLTFWKGFRIGVYKKKKSQAHVSSKYTVQCLEQLWKQYPTAALQA